MTMEVTPVPKPGKGSGKSERRARRKERKGDWVQARDECRERDKFCQAARFGLTSTCDLQTGLAVHHVHTRSEGGLNIGSNLVLLCDAGHHRWVHKHPTWAKGLGLLTMKVNPVQVQIGEWSCRQAGQSGEVSNEAAVIIHNANVNRTGHGTYLTFTATPEILDELLRFFDRRSVEGVVHPGNDPAHGDQDQRRYRNAYNSIRKVLDLLAKHPAYRSKAIVGNAYQTFDAWREVDPYGFGGDERWWPTATQAHARGLPLERKVLVPEQFTYRRQRLTRWTPTDPSVVLARRAPATEEHQTAPSGLLTLLQPQPDS